MTSRVEFERRVRDAVEAVLAGGRLEDSVFEAKWDVPQIVKVAERLAGHANAAQGLPIIWIFGLDEQQKQVNPDLELDPADLSQRLEARFDERAAPKMTEHQWLRVSGGRVFAIEFDTSLPPYVVRRDTTDDWALVVPWRYGTRVQGARRGDLQRALLRQAGTPRVRPLEAVLTLSDNGTVSLSGRYLFSLDAGSQPAFMPYQDIRLVVSTPTLQNLIEVVNWGEWDRSGAGSRAIWTFGSGRVREPDFAHATRSGIAIEWVGSVPFGADGDLFAPFTLGPIRRSKRIALGFEGRVLGSNARIVHSAFLYRKADEPTRWELEPLEHQE